MLSLQMIESVLNPFKDTSQQCIGLDSLGDVCAVHVGGDQINNFTKKSNQNILIGNYISWQVFMKHISMFLCPVQPPFFHSSNHPLINISSSSPSPSLLSSSLLIYNICIKRRLSHAVMWHPRLYL